MYDSFQKNMNITVLNIDNTKKYYLSSKSVY